MSIPYLHRDIGECLPLGLKEKDCPSVATVSMRRRHAVVAPPPKTILNKFLGYLHNFDAPSWGVEDSTHSSEPAAVISQETVSWSISSPKWEDMQKASRKALCKFGTFSMQRVCLTHFWSCVFPRKYFSESICFEGL